MASALESTASAPSTPDRTAHLAIGARYRRPGQGIDSARQVTALEIPPQEEWVTVRKMAAYVSHGALEVLGGTRLAQQMSRLLDQKTFANLLARAELTDLAKRTRAKELSRLHQSIQIRSVHGCRVAPGIYEMSVVVAERLRCRAIALRIEQQGGNWKVTALLIG